MSAVSSDGEALKVFRRGALEVRGKEESKQE
jgi:hypothetical protein